MSKKSKPKQPSSGSGGQTYRDAPPTEQMPPTEACPLKQHKQLAGMK